MSVSEPATTPRRILVPLDGSRLAEAVLPSVEGLARPLALEIALLRVVLPVPPRVVEGMRQIVVANPVEALTREANDYLGGVAEQLCARGLTVSTVVRAGDPATEILAGAREWQADLIAMTTHGWGGLRRLIFGSTADAVLRRADIPLFLVRRTEAEVTRRAA